jgi:iron complex outermembrane receptor protein
VSAEEIAIMEELKAMSLEELGEVMIKLDDTFDIFNGILYERKMDIATGTAQWASRLPSVTSLITAQDIEVMGARTLEEALQSVPGLQVVHDFLNNPDYVLRGVSSSALNAEVLVLVNGIRLNSNYMGTKAAWNWSGFPVSTIARIEIIRGPGSALYGADAFAGVINIITKNAEDIDGTEMGGRVGNYNTRDAWILHGSRWKGFEIAAMLQFNDTDGHSTIIESDGQTLLDEEFGTDVSLAPGPFDSGLTAYDAFLEIAKQHWRFRGGIHKAEVGLGVGLINVLDGGDKQTDDERLNADITYDNPQITDTWGMEARISYLHTGRETEYMIYPPGAFGGAFPLGMRGTPGNYEHHTHLDLTGLYRGLKNHGLRLGIGYANYDLYKITEFKNFGTNPFTGEPIDPTEMVEVSDTDAAYMPEVARENWYTFMQDTWAITEQWELTAGIRYDKYSDFGSTTNPRMGLVWEVRPGFVTKLLYGRAFRAPAFMELYAQNNPSQTGNPDLVPEKIETWELAFDYRLSTTANMMLNLFQYEVTDKILTIPYEGGDSALIMANAGTWEGMGGEFELRWKTSNKSSLLFNYSYQDSEDENGITLPAGSQQTAYIRGDYLLGSKWYLDTQLHWNNGWSREANGLPHLDGHTSMDVMLRRKESRGGKTNFALGVRNLFDAEQTYPPIEAPGRADSPGAGRFYFVEFRYKF